MNPFGLLVIALGALVFYIGLDGEKKTSAAKKKAASVRTKVPGTSLPSGGPPMPAVKGKYTSPALPGFQVYGGEPGTINTGIPPAGYTVVGPPPPPVKKRRKLP